MHTVRVVGCGTVDDLHLTPEARIHIRASRKALCLGSMPNIISWLEEEAILSEDVTGLYLDGALDDANYARILSKIYSEIERFGDISLVIPGHPRLGVTLVQTLSASTNHGNIDLRVVPGISSFDTLINDLALDPLEEGTCIVDVNRLILHDYAMEPAINYCVYHVSSIGNARTDYKNPTARNRVDILQSKLSGHYARDHVLILVTSAQSRKEAARIHKGTIGTLPELLEGVTFSTTLFIPARMPVRVNKEFLQLLMASAD